MVVLSKPSEQYSMTKAHNPASSSNIGIPLIDLSNPTDSKHCLVKACEEYGFFKVTNHGVPMEIISKLEAEAVKFFSLPISEKHKTESPAPFGYGNKLIGSNGDMGWVEYLLLTTNPEFNSQISFPTSGGNPDSLR